MADKKQTCNKLDCQEIIFERGMFSDIDKTQIGRKMARSCITAQSCVVSVCVPHSVTHRCHHCTHLQSLMYLTYHVLARQDIFNHRWTSRH